MSDERLTDEEVANLAVWIADSGITKREGELLAREVQAWRNKVESPTFHRFIDTTTTIDALCARYDIDIDGIVRLADNVFQPAHPDDDPVVEDYVEWLRRLARGECDESCQEATKRMTEGDVCACGARKLRW